MKYGVWFVRLLFAAWMIPAGLNHFVQIFPQPMGSQPLSQELISALIDSHLFDIVKAVELFAGVAVLIGFHAPLALLMCMPVSFCVFWWDAPLEGWGSRAALFGYSVLLCNVLLCVAYARSFRGMFAWRAAAGDPGGYAGLKQLVPAARILFGAWLLASGLNHFFLHLWPVPAGHEPLAVQLMAAFDHSGLMDVAMLIMLAAGALLLAGRYVPVALCIVMPVSTCALYWALALDRQLAGALLALLAFALNGLLMLAYLAHYRDTLQRRAVTLGEVSGSRMTFDVQYVQAGGRSTRAEFVPALLTLLAAILFFALIVKGRTAQWCLVMLLVPAVLLHARRLRDMGYTAWLLLVPAALLLTTQIIRLKMASLGTQLDAMLPPTAVVVGLVMALWGCLGSSQAEVRLAPRPAKPD